MDYRTKDGKRAAPRFVLDPFDGTGILNIMVSGLTQRRKPFVDINSSEIARAVVPFAGYFLIWPDTDHA